jgi:hypothetical protein
MMQRKRIIKDSANFKKNDAINDKGVFEREK